MSLERVVIGVRKPDFGATKELKVKVTVRTWVNLHAVKMSDGIGISDVVNQALQEFFATRTAGSARDRADDPRRGA